MKQLFTAEFWNYAGERAIKSASQGAVALIGVGAVDAIADTGNVFLQFDWVNVGTGAALMAILSILTSLGSDWGKSTPETE